jgi:hypothetical protein
MSHAETNATSHCAVAAARTVAAENVVYRAGVVSANALRDSVNATNDVMTNSRHGRSSMVTDQLRHPHYVNALSHSQQELRNIHARSLYSNHLSVSNLGESGRSHHLDIPTPSIASSHDSVGSNKMRNASVDSRIYQSLSQIHPVSTRLASGTEGSTQSNESTSSLSSSVSNGDSQRISNDIASLTARIRSRLDTNPLI